MRVELGVPPGVLREEGRVEGGERGQAPRLSCCSERVVKNGSSRGRKFKCRTCGGFYDAEGHRLG